MKGSSVTGTVAVVFARVLIPIWLAVGAVLKMVDMSPIHLPAVLIKWCGAMGIDLMFVMRFSIAAELIVAGVMILLPPVARAVGVVVLTAFVPVLIGDLILGASTCGCFGAVEMSPWVTLVMDVTFLFGLAFLGRNEPRLAMARTLPTSRVLIAGLWSLVSVALAFGLSATPQGPNVEGAGGFRVDGGITSTPDLPADGYFLPRYDEWVGRPFRQLDIATWISYLPENIDVETQYVIFYRKDCEHCHELMELYFNQSLPAPTVAVAVPERGGFPTEKLQPFACPGCELAELPAGVDWFLQTPVLVRLAGGVVECAAEVDASAPECLAW